ncbi:MAG: PH domain-containing protein [Gemmatimonadaceae bacterium]|nr:PH domain-containing protein [Gemmatimonadaceae bacterium]
MSLFNTLKERFANYKAQKAEERATEEARKALILAGSITPIRIPVALQPNEVAYLELSARRMVTVDRIEETTVGKTKKKGVVARAVVGGVLLGPLGALGGATTAGSKFESKTTQKTVSSVEVLDTGRLIFTNKRVAFLGQDVLSLPYEQIMSVAFASGFWGNRLTLTYQGMLNGEHFMLSGPNAQDTELYYRGIINNLLDPRLARGI